MILISLKSYLYLLIGLLVLKTILIVFNAKLVLDLFYYVIKHLKYIFKDDKKLTSNHSLKYNINTSISFFDNPSDNISYQNYFLLEVLNIFKKNYIDQSTF